MTSAGEYAPFFDRLPHDIPALAKVVQGLGQRARPASQLLARILERDGRPLDVA